MKKGYIVILWDGLSAHRAGAVKEFVQLHSDRLSIYRLPAYCPDFNPVEWLWAEVTLWTKALDGGPQADQLRVRDRLARLWADPDLAGLFDPDALDKLSPAERQECRALWSDVDAQLTAPPSSP